MPTLDCIPIVRSHSRRRRDVLVAPLLVRRLAPIDARDVSQTGGVVEKAIRQLTPSARAPDVPLMRRSTASWVLPKA
jgi:hypothetical protein